MIVFSTVGALLASRLPGNPIGWLFLTIGLLESVGGVTDAYTTQNYDLAGPSTLSEIVAVISGVMQGPILILFLAALLVLFPDGRLPPGWRIPAMIELGAGAVLCVTAVFSEGSMQTSLDVQNPIGVSGVAGTVVSGVRGVAFFTLLGLMVASAVSLVRRYRRATGELRQQLKWFGWSGGILAITFVCAVKLPVRDRINRLQSG